MTTNKKLWTWADIWEDIGEEMEVADEDLVSENRVKKWFNDGVDSAEAIINRTNQEYFLQHQEPLPFEDGIDTYDTPDDLYASKIRDVIINNGSRCYQATRFSDSKKFITYRADRVQPASPTDELGYFLANESSATPRMIFSPVPSDTSWSYEIWYYRQANRMVDDEDICDIPEFIEYVFQWVRERIEWKRRPGTPAHMNAVQRLAELEERMVTTLQDMVVDGQDEIEQDTAHYEEHN